MNVYSAVREKDLSPAAEGGSIYMVPNTILRVRSYDYSHASWMRPYTLAVRFRSRCSAAGVPQPTFYRRFAAAGVRSRRSAGAQLEGVTCPPFL